MLLRRGGKVTARGWHGVRAIPSAAECGGAWSERAVDPDGAEVRSHLLLRVLRDAQRRARRAAENGYAVATGLRGASARTVDVSLWPHGAAVARCARSTRT